MQVASWYMLYMEKVKAGRGAQSRRRFSMTYKADLGPIVVHQSTIPANSSVSKS